MLWLELLTFQWLVYNVIDVILFMKILGVHLIDLIGLKRGILIRAYIPLVVSNITIKPHANKS